MHASTVNGITMSYTDEGQGAPALVFIHGFPLVARAWSRQVDGFQSTHRVIAPDLRGLGQTEAQPGTNTMDRFAERRPCAAPAARDRTGRARRPFHGRLRRARVRAALSRVLRGLVLVSTKAGADTPEGAAGRRATAEKVKLEGIDGVVNAMAPKMLAASNQDAAMAAQVRDLMEPSKPEGVIGALLGMAERPDSTPKLGQIRVPTLVITGADDTVIPPAESDLLAKNIPGAQLQRHPQRRPPGRVRAAQGVQRGVAGVAAPRSSDGMTVAEAAPFEGPLFSTQTEPQERIFPKLSPERFERLAARGRLRPVEAGEVLIEAGAPVTRLFLVKSGRLDVVRPSVMPGAARAERLVTVVRVRSVHRRGEPALGPARARSHSRGRAGRGVRDRSRGAACR